MRLQKYMASSGVASRRSCESIINESRVKVNGKIVNVMGYKVDPERDVVQVDDKVIKLNLNYEYYILNKPIGVVCTAKDEKNRPTVVDMIESKKRLYPVGRLDIDSTGLVLLTNDGELTNKILHPRNKIKKTYIATVEGKPSKEGLEKLRNGIFLDGAKTSPAKVDILKVYETDSIVKITITEGRNHQVKNMFLKIGNPVKKLKRISIGEIELGGLEQGYYRPLEKEELDYLRSIR